MKLLQSVLNGYKLYEPYFSELARLRSNDITKIDTFDDMLILIVWIMTDNDDVQVKMPDDGLGTEFKKKKKKKCTKKCCCN